MEGAICFPTNLSRIKKNDDQQQQQQEQHWQKFKSRDKQLRWIWTQAHIQTRTRNWDLPMLNFVPSLDVNVVVVEVIQLLLQINEFEWIAYECGSLTAEETHK